MTGDRRLRRGDLGKKGEQLAVFHLENLGYKIVERNFRCKLGEIDIVAYDGNVLVFIEVRTRKSNQFGDPLSSVTHRKQKKLITLANFYMKKHRLFNRHARFDVVGICMEKSGNASIELIKNAFEES